MKHIKDLITTMRQWEDTAKEEKLLRKRKQLFIDTAHSTSGQQIVDNLGLKWIVVKGHIRILFLEDIDKLGYFMDDDLNGAASPWWLRKRDDAGFDIHIKGIEHLLNELQELL